MKKFEIGDRVFFLYHALWWCVCPTALRITREVKTAGGTSYKPRYFMLQHKGISDSSTKMMMATELDIFHDLSEAVEAAREMNRSFVESFSKFGSWAKP